MEDKRYNHDHEGIMNGVSKKLCITATGIAAIYGLADGATNNLPYALAIAIMCVVYKLVQGYIDTRK